MIRIPPLKKPTNIQGHRFDKLVAEEYRAVDNKWRCRCDCGGVAYRRLCDMRSNIRRGCKNGCDGCRVRIPPNTTGMKVKRESLDLSGETFGNLFVVGPLRKTPSGTVWVCQCQCEAGQTVHRSTGGLRKVKNPGCTDCEADRRATVHLTHGGALGGASRLYSIWKGMLSRCRDLENPNYGGKGIQVCQEWEDFGTFRKWALGAGYELNLTIERENPHKGYYPANCAWITREENSRRVHNPRYLQMNGIRA